MDLLGEIKEAGWDGNTDRILEELSKEDVKLILEDTSDSNGTIGEIMRQEEKKVQYAKQFNYSTP